MKNILFILTILSGVSCSSISRTASAGLITTVSNNVVGDTIVGFEYTYTVDSKLSSDISAIGFRLAISSSVEIRDIIAPPGWLVSYVPGDELIVWESPSPNFDIAPGNSATFAFISNFSPGQISYDVLGFDDQTFDIKFVTGVTTGPVATVPEPTSCLSILGLAACSLLHRKRLTKADVREPRSPGDCR